MSLRVDYHHQKACGFAIPDFADIAADVSFASAPLFGEALHIFHEAILCTWRRHFPDFRCVPKPITSLSKFIFLLTKVRKDVKI